MQTRGPPDGAREALPGADAESAAGAHEALPDAEAWSTDCYRGWMLGPPADGSKAIPDADAESVTWCVLGAPRCGRMVCRQMGTRRSRMRTRSPPARVHEALLGAYAWSVGWCDEALPGVDAWSTSWLFPTGAR